MECIPIFQELDYKVFRLQVGTGIATTKAFRDALVKHDCNIDKDADELLGTPGFLVVSKVRCDIALALINNRQLGLKGWATADESHRKALDWGLELVQSEVGLQYCLQTTLHYSLILMGMNPILNAKGVPRVLSFYQEGNIKLVGAKLTGDALFPGRTTWAYKIPDYLFM